MKSFVIAVLLLAGASAPGQSRRFLIKQQASSSVAQVIDWINTGEFGTAGDWAETNNLWRSTQTSLTPYSPGTGWSFNPAGDGSNFFKISDRQFTLQKPFQIRGGSLYNDAGTRGISIWQNTNVSKKCQWRFNTEPSNCVFTVVYVNNITNTDFCTWDLILLESSGSAFGVVQWRSGSGFYYVAHSNAGVGSQIVQTNASHTNVFCGKYEAGNRFTLNAYDWNTHAQIGTNSFLALENNALSTISFAIYGHGCAQNVTNYLDNLMFSTNLSDFPILPW